MYILTVIILISSKLKGKEEFYAKLKQVNIFKYIY